jgi:hypothetical protein
MFCIAMCEFFIEPLLDTQRTERQGERGIWVAVCCYLLWATPPPHPHPHPHLAHHFTCLRLCLSGLEGQGRAPPPHTLSP